MKRKVLHNLNHALEELDLTSDLFDFLDVNLQKFRKSKRIMSIQNLTILLESAECSYSSIDTNIKQCIDSNNFWNEIHSMTNETYVKKFNATFADTCPNAIVEQNVDDTSSTGDNHEQDNK